MDFGTCLEHRQEKSIECPICVIEERDQLRAEVERLRGELEQARAEERERCIEVVRTHRSSRRSMSATSWRWLSST